MLGYRERDPAGEEGLVLTLSPRPLPQDIAAILQRLRRFHPRPHWPLRLESVDTIPILPNGKIDLRALRESEVRDIHWRQHIPPSIS